MQGHPVEDWPGIEGSTDDVKHGTWHPDLRDSRLTRQFEGGPEISAGRRVRGRS
jgi:hypothetical protein